MLARTASVAFALFLIAGVPFLSLDTIRRPEIRLAPRSLIYLSAVFSQWVLTLICGALVIWRPASLIVSGLRLCPANVFLKWTLLVALAGIGSLLVVILAEERGWWPRETEITHLLMPESKREKLMALSLVAPTAGICEEFLYRGFLLSEFYRWCHSLWGALVLSSIVFALAHLYQGRLGALRVGFLGALLAWPAVVTGSLYPSMTAHFLIDAAALLWLGPRFLKANPREPDLAGGPEV